MSIGAEEDHTVTCVSWNAFGAVSTGQPEPENICYSEDMGELADRQLRQQWGSGANAIFL